MPCGEQRLCRIQASFSVNGFVAGRSRCFCKDSEPDRMMGKMLVFAALVFLFGLNADASAATSKKMFTRRLILCVIVLLMVFVRPLSAATERWTGGGGANNLWSNVANWSGRVPLYSDTAYLGGNYTALINSTVAALASNLYGPGADVAGFFTLNMTGGSLAVRTDNMVLGYSALGSGLWNMSGGTVTINDELWVSNGGTATITMTGGTINIALGLYIPMVAAGNGHVDLDGGVINAGSFSMRPSGGTGTMDITGGTLIVNGNVVSTINGYISSGWITAYDGMGTVNVDYNVTNPGKTTVWATWGLMYWSGNFSPIALANIGNRDQICQGSSQVTLYTSGNAEISADNTDTARLTKAGGANLYTEYKLQFDGDGVSQTGGSTVDFTSYDLFLSSPSTVTHISGDNAVQVTLHVRASNYANDVADAGTYTATQTLTVHWVGP